jgi:hypothetical protein
VAEVRLQGSGVRPSVCQYIAGGVSEDMRVRLYLKANGADHPKPARSMSRRDLHFIEAIEREHECAWQDDVDRRAVEHRRDLFRRVASEAAADWRQAEREFWMMACVLQEQLCVAVNLRERQALELFVFGRDGEGPAFVAEADAPFWRKASRAAPLPWRPARLDPNTNIIRPPQTPPHDPAERIEVIKLATRPNGSLNGSRMLDTPAMRTVMCRFEK